ncbi:radical SAM/SPASM domain-containing protein [Ascidiimonas sp. W6]|uniref:radical SAM/SPASM domain-containing protein n=1 Tax=Ascidiimonas meishanensis TaxID=3128903 RepID=UPI0030EBBD84
MKYSQFNSIIPFDNSFYLYNSYTQKFIIIAPLLKDLLEASIMEGIDGLEEIHPDFYKYLKSEEFLVPNNVDEVEKIRKIVKTVDENNSSFLLTINPTMNCNFKCWYCYETHIKKSSFSDSMIDKVSKFIEKTAQKPAMNFFNLSFFGGEPLLYFKRDVVPVIQKLQKECVENSVDYAVSFTTNGYLVDDYFINFFKSHGIAPALQITLDGYGKKHDAVRYVTKTKGSYVEIVSNIKLLLNNSFPVRLRINYTKDNIEDAYKISDEFDDIDMEIKNDFLLVDFHRVWQDSDGEDIPMIVDQNLEYMKSKGLTVKHNSPNNVVESCYADKRNSAVINYNGDIYKCTARDFTTANRAGYLTNEGDLIWENNYLERRMEVKFKNKPCLTCRLMPICNGGCSQHAMEALEEGGRGEYCIYEGDEKIKDDVVKSKIEEIIETLELNEA